MELLPHHGGVAAEALKPPANAAAASTETAGWALLISHKVGQPGVRYWRGRGERRDREERGEGGPSESWIVSVCSNCCTSKL